MKDNEFNIPSNIFEMTLQEYMKILTIISENKDNEPLAEKKIVQYFTGYSMKEVSTMSQIRFDAIIRLVTRCINDRPQFEAAFEFEGVTYGFIPKLEDMSTAEFLDAETHMSSVDSWHKLMAVLFRPIRKVRKNSWFRKKQPLVQYDIEEYEGSSKYCNLMLRMPAGYAVSAMVFFWNLNRDLLTISHTYMVKAVELEKCPKKKESLEKILDGINQSMQLLGETFSSLNLSLKKT